MTDDDLLQHYANERSDPAFAELVRRHIDLVYSAALPKVGRDAHAASDVVQQVFTALAGQARALLGRRELAGWLYLTTHHLAAQHVRTERRRQARESEAHAMQEISRRTEIDWDRVRPVLDEVVQELGGADREAVLLRFFEQRSYAEIGAALRATEDAARMRVDRALEKLRSRLAARGVSSTAAALAAALGQQMAAAPAGLAATVAGNAVLAGAPIAAGAGFSFTILATAGTLGVAGLVAAFVWVPRAPEPVVAPSPVASTVTGSRPTATLPAPVPASARHIVIDAKDRAAGRTVPPVGSEPPAKKKVPPTRQSTIERVVSAYTPLIEQLGLDAASAEKFRALLTARAGHRYDVNAVATQQRLTSEDVDIRDLLSEADEELTAALRQEFGASFLEAYQRYFRGLAFTKQVNQLVSQLADTSTPIVPAQAVRLRDLLAERGGVRAADSSDPFEWARPVLSPAQLASLRERAAHPGGK